MDLNYKHFKDHICNWVQIYENILTRIDTVSKKFLKNLKIIFFNKLFYKF
jgi:hypothetical protein